MDDEFSVTAVDYRDPGAPARFTDSLRRTGFGVLRNQPAPSELLEQIHREWLDFFESDAKYAYAVKGGEYDGFFSTEKAETAKTHHRQDLKEYFHIYGSGRYPSEVSDAARRYYDLVGAVAQELLGWVEANTPTDVRNRFSMPLPQMIAGSPLTLLRVLRYPPLNGNEPPDALRSAPHEDINFLTVLASSNEPGLQLLRRDGHWADVPCDFGSLAINVGDMLQEVSGGYYRSTTHRVVNPTGDHRDRSRISLPLFLHPRAEVVLSDRYTAGSYLAERIKELRRGQY